MACLSGGQLGCSVIVGADFDVFLRKKDATSDDAATPNDAGARSDAPADTAQDATSGGDAAAVLDARWDGDRIDGGPSADANDAYDRDGEARDARDGGSGAEDAFGVDASDGGGGADDVSDAADVLDPRPEPRPEGGIGPTVVMGSFVGSGVPARTSSVIELRGHVISNGTIGGRTAGGITIEGRFR